MNNKLGTPEHLQEQGPGPDTHGEVPHDNQAPPGYNHQSDPPAEGYQSPPAQGYEQAPVQGYQQAPGQGYQQAAGYANQPPPGYGYQAPPVIKKRNIIGIVALVVAILGSAFAVWPATYIVGWILLPVAFVLSLVALFQKDKTKGLAIAALVVSIVGSMAGGVAVLVTLGTAMDEAFTNETSIVEPGTAEADDLAGEDGAEEPAAETAGEQGTRGDPAPLGATAVGEDWEVTVNSFTADATDQILEFNEFNEAPDEGSVYALVNVTAKYVGDESGYPLEIDVDYVTAGGNVIGMVDTYIVAPEDFTFASELYAGAEATGNVGLMIPASDAGTIRVSPGFFADEVFFSIT